MASAVYTPRVNNNDDAVRLTRLAVRPGDEVHAGDIVAEVETDKASFTVESEHDGFVLEVAHPADQMISVGSVLLWVGASPDETVPKEAAPAPNGHAPAQAHAPTLKAAQMLAAHGLRGDEVPAAGERLTVADVEAFLARRPAAPGPARQEAPARSDSGDISRPLTSEERAMVRTVQWHRDEAVPGYVEIQYDTSAWAVYAQEYQRKARALVSPLLPLMAYHLVRLTARHERWNSTIRGDQRVTHGRVNLGFTVQSEDTLYLTVVAGADRLSTAEFVARLAHLQKRALSHSLQADEVTGATVSFSSMARWQVSRHVPVLPPYTSLIIAHAAAVNERGTLGATYDHRVLTGADALEALRALSQPEVFE